MDEAHSLVRCGHRRNFPFVRGSRHSGAQADGVHPALPCLGSTRHGAPLGARVSSVQASRETAGLLRDPPPRAGRRGPGPSRALCLLPAASVLLSGPRASPADLPANLLTRRPRVIRSQNHLVGPELQRLYCLPSLEFTVDSFSCIRILW